MYLSSLLIARYYSPLPGFILLSEGWKHCQTSNEEKQRTGILVYLCPLLPVLFLLLFLEAVMKQESNFCIGYKDYTTPVVTADRFKCHLRKGAARKAAL